MVVPAESWYYQSPTNQFNNTVYINAGDVKVIGLTDDDQNADAMNVMIPSWLL